MKKSGKRNKMPEDEPEDIHGECAREIKLLKNALSSALSHCLANQNSVYEFYSCHTYNHGELPRWVKEAKDALGITQIRTVKWKHTR